MSKIVNNGFTFKIAAIAFFSSCFPEENSKSTVKDISLPSPSDTVPVK